MENDYLLSLVIPTNGVKEWVFPVLDSIYSQEVDEDKFEVIVTDNGQNDDFYHLMMDYSLQHSNLVYKRTTSKLFSNQIEGFKLATGHFIKFVNHRFQLKQGALNYLINFVKSNILERPITYFLNGTTEIAKNNNSINPFDEFVYGLKNYSSWSGGVSCWREDLKNVLENDINSELFPHVKFVFLYDENKKYKIDNNILFEEIPDNSLKKGNYDLFFAFGIEYVELIKNLRKQGMIAISSEEFILKENENFLANMFLYFIIMKKPCSYNLDSVKTSLNRYYSLRRIRCKAIFNMISLTKRKIVRAIGELYAKK
ncbi:glycosyltransferase [Streptococcus gallolyticus]|uniref:glycosyltransferase n=1 Tax=Streptococcus gallolyticus TaxID=315405 RepID=UPI001F4788F4|nr:glycosyltransferase [Streptococcus gallolyticus]MCF1633478.1 glycosyltransferase [Streptococcus gallolyticus]MCF2567193.1 glycosyltransferase [Streptococcus pasteurianus]MCY7187478.1 glycosyltransferase [Streptococcus gallolyticus subsp. gallolyticus]